MENVEQENLDIKGVSGTYLIPSVNFNTQTGVCMLEGESYLEDTWGFYDKLLSWLKTYMQTKKALVFNFRFTYFNTSSSKCLLDMMKLLKEYQESNTNLTVNWHYPQEDDDNKTEAEDFIADTNLNMNLIPY